MLNVPDDPAATVLEQMQIAAGIPPLPRKSLQTRPLAVSACIAWAQHARTSGWWVIDDASGCWLVPTQKSRPRAEIDGATTIAYRAMWVVLHETDVPEGKVLDHVVCGNGEHCINPTHVEPVFHAENTIRASTGSAVSANAQRTECVNGHSLLDVDNLVKPSWEKGMRRCLKCARASQRNRAALVSQAHKALGITQKEYIAKYGTSLSVARAFIDK